MLNLTARLRRFSFRLPQGAEPLVSVFFLVCDMFLLNFIFKQTFYVWLSDSGSIEPYITSYNHVKWYLFAFYVFFGAFTGIFNVRSLKAASDIFFHSISSLLSSFILFNLVGFMSREFAALTHNFPRPIMIIAAFIGAFAVFAFRVLVTRLFKTYPNLVKAIIIGDLAEGKRIINHFHRRGGVRFRIVRSMQSDEIGELASEVIFKHVHEVFVTDTNLNLDKFWAQIYYNRKEEPHRFNVRLSVDPSKNAASVGLHSLEDFPLITIPSHPLSAAQKFLKRVFDIFFSIFAIILTSPVMLLTAVGVKLDSPGPVFYKQKRVGLNGKEYDVIKFRSMRMGAESQSGPIVSTADDPRVSRFCKFIRRFGIDELPQFFLVLIGEMSVVGPRPERPFFVNEDCQFQGRRLSVKPGVTGLAVVNSRYYLKLSDKVTYDYYYIDYYSILLDIKIVFQTVWVLLFEPKYSK